LIFHFLTFVVTLKIQVDPAYRVVSGNVSSLILGIQCSLRQGINLNCKFNVEFRLDVFSYLFNGKGSLPPSGQGKLYNVDDFNPTYFPFNWFIVYDKLGNGCKVDFPPYAYKASSSGHLQ